MEVTESETPKQENAATETAFKKPMLVGKIGKFPKKLKNFKAPSSVTETPQKVDTPTEPPEKVDTPAEVPVDLASTVEKPENIKNEVKSVPYEVPSWSGLPGSSDDYILEVLKNGSIIETINLMQKPFWVFGRLANCNICMQHPTISRYHAVLQYRVDDGDKQGFYIYDLESTHGTFLNKNRLKPRSYVRIHVGHMLKLGCSTRTYILNGPSEDAEEESALTVTELKQKREQELRQRELKKLEEEERLKREEERGVDWGMGEDAEEETDLAENPYAQTNNEDLYLDNPKKALRGFFEREGLELEYDCTEQGMGQFLCKVELPIDDEVGRPIFAEVFHKGKKKEAVVQCALEACRILDRHGLLRQATHESKKRKPKNWEENDYYDSDDDTFLDRTGTVEKKREMRMNAKVPQKAETYDSLMEKEKTISDSIRKLEIQLSEAQRKLSSLDGGSSSEVDPLDSFMMELNKSKPNKQTVNKLKSELLKLKQEHGNIIKLVNIAKPASLPPLVAQYSSDSMGKSAEKKGMPLFGKRKKIKLQIASKSTETHATTVDDGEEEEEEEEDDDYEKASAVKDSEEDRIPRVEITREQNKDDDDRNKSTSEDEEMKINDSSSSVQKEMDPETLERKRRKNQRRIHQKHEKAEIMKQKGYDEDASKEDYNMWVPPTGQTGDGRTALNDKFGY